MSRFPRGTYGAVVLVLVMVGASMAVLSVPSGSVHGAPGASVAPGVATTVPTDPGHNGAVPAHPASSSELSLAQAPARERAAAPQASVASEPSDVAGGASGSDYSALAPSGTLIGSTVGTFPSTTGLASEYNGASGLDPKGSSACSVANESNCYSLQINSQVYPFVSTAFTGTSDYKSMWEQFVYENDPTGGNAHMYIQYVLIGSIPAKNGCNGTVAMDGVSWGVFATQPGNCYGASPSQSVPSSFLSAPLSSLEFETFADYMGSGNDVLQICSTLGLGCSSPLVITDSVMDLGQYWDASEFNVFGDADGSEANFSTPTTISVSTAISDQSGNPIAASCEGYSATGETNNLFLGPCSASGSAISFTESSEIYSISVSPSDLTVLRGQSVTYNVGVTLTKGTAAPVTLSLLSGLPSGASTSFLSGTVTPNATSTLFVTTSLGGGLGDYTFTVQGQFGGLEITGSATLHVYDFAVDLAPPGQTVLRGTSTEYALNLTLLPGSSTVGVPAILLSLSGLPGDATYSFSAASITPTVAGCTLLTIPDCQYVKVSTRGPPAGSLGDFPFIVTGTDPSASGGSRDAGASLHIFDFTVTLAPSSVVLPQGSSVGMTVSVGLVSGSSTVSLPNVNLSLSGIPSGVVALGFPTSLGIGGSQAFTLETSTVGGYVSCPQVSNHGGQNLQYANLAHCNLAGYDLKGDNLQYANLEGADLQNANLAGCNLQYADLASANTAGTNFQGDNLQGVDLSAATPIGVFTLTAKGTADGGFRTGTATLTVLGDQLSGDDLQGVNLQNSNLAGDVAVGTDFQGDNLQSSDLAGADLQGANVQGANLQYDDLAGADVQGANFQGDNLRDVDLAGATLTGLGPLSSQLTNFNGVNLQSANFAGAICGSPNYITANGANLHGATSVPASCNPPLDPPLSPAHSPLGAALELLFSPSAALGATFVLEMLAGIVGALLILRPVRPPRTGAGSSEPTQR
jgi:uncharacterized protein YjbI with pentapeptide repeats